MGVQLNFRYFSDQYSTVSQGVFWLESDRWCPPKLPRVNVGLLLSEKLIPLSPQQRKENVFQLLKILLGEHKSIILENIQVLFLPSLALDIPALMVALARNRILCIVWPGRIEGQRLIYAQPTLPEYAAYEAAKYVDSYVITR